MLYENNLNSTESILNKSNSKWKNMMKEMQEMDDDITNEMQVKTRLIQINNEEAKNKNNFIMIILGSFSSFFIGLFGWIAYMSGKISKQNLFFIFILSAFVFVFLSVVLNTGMLEKLKKYSEEIKNILLEGGDDLNLKAIEWTDENCDCSGRDN